MMLLEEEKKDDLSVSSINKLSADNMFNLGGFLTYWDFINRIACIAISYTHYS